MHARPALLLFTAALIAGGWIGHAAASSRGNSTADTRSNKRATSTPSPAHTRDRRPSDDSHPRSFEDLLALLLRESPGGPESAETLLAEALASWTPEQLHAALMGSLGDYQIVLENAAPRRLAKALLAAWMKKDAAGAITWFSGHPNKIQSSWLAETLVAGWPEGRREDAIRLMVEEPMVFEGKACAGLMDGLVEQAALLGPAEVDRLLGRFVETGLGEKWDRIYGSTRSAYLEPKNLRFPPDFDFTALSRMEGFNALRKQAFVNGITEAWARQDRDGLLDYAIGTADEMVLTSLFMAGLGHDVISRWYGERYGKMNSAGREWMRSLEWIWLGEGRTLPMLQGIGDPAIREEIAASAVVHLMKGDTATAFSFLETLPSPGRRLHVLETADPNAIGASYVEVASLATEGELRPMREKLAGWGATPARAEAIIQRYLAEVEKRKENAE